MYAYFEDEIARRKGNPGDDLLGSLLVAEIDGKKLEHNEILDICFLMLIAGLDTVTSTLGCNIAYLAENPDQRRRIVEDPALIPAAVEELLRWETPVTAVPRKATRDVTIQGFEIKAGEIVTFMIASANTDDAHFKDAQTVDFDRERNIHMAFGAGRHRCLGSHLARMELQVAMEEWHKRIPDYAIKPGETPTYSAGIREVTYLPLVWNA
jgi:cytochrome P450